MPAWRFAAMLYTADAKGWTRFATMQNHYNLIYREEEREMIPLCLEERIGVDSVEPARTRTSGRKSPPHIAPGRYGRLRKEIYGDQIGETDLRVIERLESVSAEIGVAPAQVALAWLMQKPGVVAPIVGASKPGHLADALTALTVRLSAEDDQPPRRTVCTSRRGGHGPVEAVYGCFCKAPCELTLILPWRANLWPASPSGRFTEALLQGG